MYYFISGIAYRYCFVGGTWETKNSSNLTYTHYENCLLSQLQDLLKMCDEFGQTTCKEVNYEYINDANSHYGIYDLRLSLISF